MVRVIGVGDNTVDRYLHQGMMYPGGNAVNVPVLARRFGHSAAYLGWLAKDPHRMLVHSSLIAEDIDVSRCRIVEGENAFCEVTQKDGDRVFGAYSAGVCGQIKLDEDDLEFIAAFDLVHTSVYSFIDPYLEKLKSAAKILSYDFSREWDKKTLAETLPYVNIAVISNPRSDQKSNEELLRFAASFGPEIVLATSGEQGVLLYDGENFYAQPVLPLEIVVDTLGAGDAFAARFFVDYLDGIPTAIALQNAAKSAAETCLYYGAFGHGVPLYNQTK